MRKLYYHPICPLSRQVRVYLKELDLTFSLLKEDYWLRSADLIRINPAGTVPVFQEEDGLIVCGIVPITEYLHEKYPTFFFLDESVEVNCEIRRMSSWFNEKFYAEVTKILIDEKIIRLFQNMGGARAEFIRAAKNNFTRHMSYMNSILEYHSFVAGENLSCADIAAACHISVLDYFGEIKWEKWPIIKDWYSVIKSRPSFRSLLQDQIPGFVVPAHYADLDF